MPVLGNKFRTGLALKFAIFVLLLGRAEIAQAQQSSFDEQQGLFARMLKEPTNYELTYKYARIASDRGDYEAAIAALERLLYYNPNLARVKYELGTLYFRLRSFSMAKRYFNEALATPGLDAATKARIEAYLPDAEQQAQSSRFAGFAQTGVRYQSNASFAPSNGIIRLGGQDLSLPSTNTKRPDSNWFGLVGLSHDYDLPQGATLESRFTAYLTDQFKLHDLNVGIVDGSIGPRIPVSSEVFPGASVKPYLTGGNIWVGGGQYLGSAGAGLALLLPANPQLSFEPGFEWRHVGVTTRTANFNEFGSGDWYTGGLAVKYGIAENVKLDARGYYRRGEGEAVWQDFNQWGAETALSFQFAPPVSSIPRMWTVTPFVRYVRTDFAAPNPFIDPAVVRIDNRWATGLVLETPINRWFGLTTTLEYDTVRSTLPNYTQQNYSILTGPTARF